MMKLRNNFLAKFIMCTYIYTRVDVRCSLAFSYYNNAAFALNKFKLEAAQFVRNKIKYK